MGMAVEVCTKGWWWKDGVSALSSIILFLMGWMLFSCCPASDSLVWLSPLIFPSSSLSWAHCLPFCFVDLDGAVWGVGDLSFPSSDAFLRTRGCFPFFWSCSQCLSQASTTSAFMWEGSFSLKSESGCEWLVKWWEGCSVMSDQGIGPPSLWYPVTYLNYDWIQVSR